MGQKVNPHGLRVGVIKDWDSRWYARPDKVGDLIVEDDKIRKYLKKRLYAAGVPTMDASQKSPRLDVLPCENVSVNTTASPQATAKPHPTSTRWLRENRSLAKYVCCCSCLFIPPPDRLHCRPWDGKNLIT